MPRRPLIFVFLAVALAGALLPAPPLAGQAGSAPPAAELSLPRLSAEFQPLRARFNQDAGKVRLLLLLDPT